jgi:transcriptional regulator with XRE-family HTH domain
MMQGSLGQRLRRARIERGLTLRSAAEVCHVTKETLMDLEHDRREPHPPTLARIAKGYGVEIADLLGPAHYEERAESPPVQPVKEPVPLADAPPESGQSKGPDPEVWGAEQDRPKPLPKSDVTHPVEVHDKIAVSDDVKADVRLEKVRQILAARDAGNITAVDADQAILSEYTAA